MDFSMSQNAPQTPGAASTQPATPVASFAVTPRPANTPLFGTPRGMALGGEVVKIFKKIPDGEGRDTIIQAARAANAHVMEDVGYVVYTNRVFRGGLPDVMDDFNQAALTNLPFEALNAVSQYDERGGFQISDDTSESVLENTSRTSFAISGVQKNNDNPLDFSLNVVRLTSVIRPASKRTRVD